ncbi:hypothetical protein [Streptomyces sp. AMCC400023]|uniref:hypothetical protein n=1 Tax=Streptomyces sp. AMCC400023 TaxID=2056258 RepID=UPI001F283884|nr:hypothetical protein [Streptomyces sp. AMCC400023]UJV42940.1 hypothetical protein CVT30_26635 [Streptomyces sp. AMCC400023]
MTDHPNLPACPAPTVLEKEYLVSLLPESHKEFLLYAVHVVREYGTDQWRVRVGGRTLDVDGVWGPPTPNGSPSRRPQTYFSLHEALTLAKAAAPNITVHGRTAVDTYLATEPE